MAKSPACENNPRPTIDGKRRGSKQHEQQPSTGTNRLAVTSSMTNPYEEIDAVRDVPARL
jgi:hypothetical protein